MRERWEHSHLPDLAPREVRRAMFAPTTPLVGPRETLARLMGRPVERGDGGRFDLPLDADWPLKRDRPGYREVTTGVWPVPGPGRSLPATPHMLAPPAGWQDYSPCEDKIRGDEDECSVWVEPRTMAEFWQLSAANTQDALEIVGGTTDERAMLRQAWAVLMDSVDLVRWSRCWYTGRSGAGDCMIRHIEGRSVNRTVIEVVDGPQPGGWDGPMSTEKDYGVLSWIAGALSGDLSLSGGTGRIWAYRGYSGWDQWLAVWKGAKPADRHCLAITLAAVLVHELSHVCHASGHVEGRSCDEAYLDGNSYLYAAYHKYPQTLESSCCGWHWGRLAEGALLFGADGNGTAIVDNTCAVMVSGEFGDGLPDWLWPDWLPR